MFAAFAYSDTQTGQIQIIDQKGITKGYGDLRKKCTLYDIQQRYTMPLKILAYFWKNMSLSNKFNIQAHYMKKMQPQQITVIVDKSVTCSLSTQSTQP